MAYLRYHDSIETRAADEEELSEKILASMARMAGRVFEKHRHGHRDAHAKSHGIVKGTLTVYGELPAHLGQGLFAEAGEYPVVARFSSAPGDVQEDRIRAPKGLAIKAMGVAGGGNQNFALVNYPVIPFGTVGSYWKLQEILEKHQGDPELLQRLVGELTAGVAAALRAVGASSGLLEALGAPHHHILGETFYSMGALRYGSYVAKICAAPLSENVRSLTGVAVETDGAPGAYRDKVVEFFANEGAEYELRAQVCRGLETMPVEDASVLWPEEVAPYEGVARLVFPAQDAYSPARRVYGDEVLSFSPWTCLEAHRPLGSIMRIRARAYEASARYRMGMNDRERVEPRGLAEIPD